MNIGPVSVLVVDDSALMRNLISRIIEDATGLRVAGTAMNGEFALQKIERLQPDIVLLDLEMPKMNGIEFLEERRKRGIDVPVVVLSSVAQKGARITMDAIGLGASDFLLKPSGAISEDIHTVAVQLTEMLRGYGREYRRRKGRVGGPDDTAGVDSGAAGRGSVSGAGSAASAPGSAARGGAATDCGGRGSAVPAGEAAAVHDAAGVQRATPDIAAAAGPTEIIVIGVSTGGPNALRKMLAAIDDGLPAPIVVVQHMPAGFTTEFARSLDRVCALEVKEAEEGDLLKPGRILIAPGNPHITVERKSLPGVVHVTDGESRNGHRPSADVLFASVAEQYGRNALAVIMTGMGRDGAVELGSIRRRGGITLGQDAASCVVYGMPRVAWELGHVQQQIPLHEMAETISRLAREQRE